MSLRPILRPVNLGVVLAAMLGILPGPAHAANTVGAIVQNAATANGNGSSVTVFGTFLVATYAVSGTFSATVNFEGSGLDGSFASLGCVPVASGAVVSSTTTTGAWRCNIVNFITIRARISGYVSGSVTVSLQASDFGTVLVGPTVDTVSATTLTNPTLLGTVTGTPTWASGQTFPNVILSPALADPGSPTTGEVWRSSTTANTVKYFDGAATRSLVDLSLTQTLTGKTLTTPIFTGYATASLPTAGTAGRLARVTDGGSSGAIVVDDGTNWRCNEQKETGIIVVTCPPYNAGTVTDPATAFQSAINAASPAGTGAGGIVYCPPGVYTTTATITLKDHVVLLGPLGPLAQRGGATGRGCVIRNNSTNDTLTYATTGDASLSTTVEGISFEATTGTGAHISIPSGSNRLFIQNNSFAGKTNAIKATDSVYDVWILANTFYNQTGHQVLFTGTLSMGPGIYFRDNYLSSPASTFSQLRYDNSAAIGPAVEITGNVFAGTTSTAPLVELSAGGNVYGLIVRANDFENFTGQTGLKLRSVAARVEGNQFASGGTGIALISATGTSVDANRFGSLTSNAVSLDAGSIANYLFENSGMAPVSDSGTRTMRLDGTTLNATGRSLKVGNTSTVLDFSGVATANILMGTTNLLFYDSAGVNPRVTMTGAGGMQVGAPTGGDKGAGTINVATTYYFNGTQMIQAAGADGTIRPTGFTFANIGTAIPNNGDFGYCSDCTIANPCAGSGTGAIAKRLNGVNVCN